VRFSATGRAGDVDSSEGPLDFMQRSQPGPDSVTVVDRVAVAVLIPSQNSPSLHQMSPGVLQDAGDAVRCCHLLLVTASCLVWMTCWSVDEDLSRTLGRFKDFRGPSYDSSGPYHNTIVNAVSRSDREVEESGQERCR
jgi:hypothetical protein